MKRVTHTLLIALFTLLQSIAPLAHAHINGQHDGIDPPKFSSPYQHNEIIVHAEGGIEGEASPTIGLSNEFQRDNHAAIPHASLALIFESHFTTVTKLLRPITSATSLPPPYSKALSQAPPHLG
jgi:hypothetical protein